MKMIFILIALLLSVPGLAEERFRVFTKVHRSQNQVSLWSSTMPIQFASKEVEEKFLKLSDGQEILIAGRMSQIAGTSLEAERMMGYLIIEEVLPVSLSSLGATDYQTATKEYYPAQEAAYQPGVLKIPETVANTVFLTSSMLLFKSLSDASQTAPVKDKINTNLILGSGLLSLGVFIWDAQ